MSTYTPSSAIADIVELNFGYLLLVQKLLKSDLEKGMKATSIRREVAEVLVSYSTEKLLKLASTNVILCRFNLNDYELLSKLASGTSILYRAREAIEASREESAISSIEMKTLVE